MSDVRGPLKAALGGERPDPDAFSRTLERVRRRDQSRRLLATVVGAVVLAGSGVGLWTGLRGLGSTPVLDSSPAPSTQESEGHVPFVPPTYREGDRVVMPLTFPDGTTAEVTYPYESQLAALGVQPDVAYLQLDNTAPRYPLTFFHGDANPAVLAGAGPAARYRIASGVQAELWSVTGELFPAHDQSQYGPLAETALLYRLPSWTVVVPVPAELRPQLIVERLEAKETPNGFVVVEARGPLALSEEPGEGRGPLLSIGDADPRESRFLPSSEPARLITLHPRVGCNPEELNPAGENSPRCFQNEEGELGVDLSVMFGEAVFGEVEVRNIRPSGLGVSAQGPDASPGATSQGFVPHTYREGERVVMPVTFPDGTTAELGYPEGLGLEELGMVPYSSGSIQGFARDFWVFYGPLEEVLARFGAPELLAEYPDGQGGTVGFWRLPDWEEVDHLAFQFGRWTVLVYDYQWAGRMRDEDRALWARSLRGRETEEGFLVLEAVPPLQLAKAGEHAGPELMFGNPASAVGALQLFPGRCTAYVEGHGGLDRVEMTAGRAVSRSEGFADFCIPEASMVVHVSQSPDKDFIDAVIRELEMRNVSLGS